MAKKPANADDSNVILQSRLEAILALLFRQLKDQDLAHWSKQDKPNMVKILIRLGFSNKEIARILGLAYGSVANIRSKGNKKRKKQ